MKRKNIGMLLLIVLLTPIVTFLIYINATPGHYQNICGYNVVNGVVYRKEIKRVGIQLLGVQVCPPPKGILNTLLLYSSLVDFNK